MSDAESKALRRLLALEFSNLVPDAHGDLIDMKSIPTIDFLRDPVDALEAKLSERRTRRIARLGPACE